MENLELQQQVINLGKVFVKELGVDKSTDTYSRWLSHYVAEKMTLAENLPSGIKKERVERECFELILDVWKHRWILPSGKRPFENFEPLLEILEKIDPERNDHFFYSLPDREFEKTVSKSELSTETENLLRMIEHIDKAARVWIDFLFHEAALKIGDEKTRTLLKNAVALKDIDDIKIITILFEEAPSDGAEKTKDNDRENKSKEEKIKSRIEELIKFSELNAYILDRYKAKLLELDK